MHAGGQRFESAYLHVIPLVIDVSAPLKLEQQNLEN